MTPTRYAGGRQISFELNVLPNDLRLSHTDKRSRTRGREIRRW